jgi:uncharacterized protein (TIGR00299 family) protein
MKETIAYLDCQSGISGDMFLGAMLDAGLTLDTLKTALSALPLEGYALSVKKFTDKGIQGTSFDVVMAQENQPSRHLSDIVSLIHASTLPEQVQATTLAIFRHLAEAEAAVHGTNIEDVHFHEVGAVDAIVDITGAAIAVAAMGITQLYASHLPLTSGHVRSEHGYLPVPAPATLEILRRVNAPWKPCPVEGEMVTPTGAAILATLARFETPAIAIEQIGYGFGQKSFPWPNCLRLCLGQAIRNHISGAAAPDTDWVTVIESNIDNMTGELLGGLLHRLLAAGALDASFTPIQMKKNRPAVMVTVMCAEEMAEALAMVLLRETSTLGVRIQPMRRLKAQRSLEQIETPIGTIHIKVKRMGSRVISAAPEYEDCVRIAQERNMPLAEVYEIAQKGIDSIYKSNP